VTNKLSYLKPFRLGVNNNIFPIGSHF